MQEKVNKVNYFGIRHLSPVSAHFLKEYLIQIKPKVILIEGMEDANFQIDSILNEKNKLPISLLAYTQKGKIEALFYPFVEYSPEYQALKWAQENNITSEFIDLCSNKIFAYSPYFNKEEVDLEQINEENIDEENIKEEKDLAVHKKAKPNTIDDYKKRVHHLYSYIAHKYNEEEYDIYWESEFEQITKLDTYINKMTIKSKLMREYLEKYQKVEDPDEYNYNMQREKNMQNNILKWIDRGYLPEEIVVVCGAYHLLGLTTPIDDKYNLLESEDIDSTISLMPYSYKNLSSLSGYGAGNIAPSYFELLWEDRKNGENLSTIKYLTKVATLQRGNHYTTSTASVLESINLAYALARLRNRSNPTLKELHDSAITVLAEGEKKIILPSLRKIATSNKIGYVHETITTTSIQKDFYNQITKLKLDKYLTCATSQIKLDLREDYTKKSEKFLGLKRSTFFIRLSILNISFCQKQKNKRVAPHFENWNIEWNPNVEIQLIEKISYGHTIELATRSHIKEELDKADSILEILDIIDKCYTGEILDVLNESYQILDGFLIKNDNFEEVVEALIILLRIYNYKTLRNVDEDKLESLIVKLYNKAIFLLHKISDYSKEEIEKYVDYIVEIYNITKNNEKIINKTLLYTELKKIVFDIDHNSMISAIALNILIKENYLKQEDLTQEVEYRISITQTKEYIADWFYGLCKINRNLVLNNEQLWKAIVSYVEQLNDEDFLLILIPFRKTFSLFEYNQKNSLYTIVSEILGIDDISFVKKVEKITNEDKKILDKINSFDFGDLL